MARESSDMDISVMDGSKLVLSLLTAGLRAVDEFGVVVLCWWVWSRRGWFWMAWRRRQRKMVMMRRSKMRMEVAEAAMMAGSL